MCDIASGDVLVAFPIGNDGLQNAVYRALEVARVQVDDPDRLSDIHFRLSGGRKYPLRHEILRLKVPVGRENASVPHIYRCFAWTSYGVGEHGEHGQPGAPFRHDPHDLRTALEADLPPLLVATNGIWQRSGPTSYSHDFSFRQEHLDALNVLRATSKASASGVRIGILDTGMDQDHEPGPIVSRINALDYKTSAQDVDTRDGDGHGTLVGALISSVVSDADYSIIKVFTDEGCSTDFNILLGLSLIDDCDVVNLSLETELEVYGSGCGESGHAAASALFESVVSDAKDLLPAVFVAAAGNAGRDELSYPARFAHVMAVKSVNSHGALSRFSNFGHLDHQMNTHEWVFVAPGGEYARDGRVAEEDLAESADGKQRYYGTSFSTAYATGVVAAYISQARANGLPYDRDTILRKVRESADMPSSGYSEQLGNGIVRLPQM